MSFQHSMGAALLTLSLLAGCGGSVGGGGGSGGGGATAGDAGGSSGLAAVSVSDSAAPSSAVAAVSSPVTTGEAMGVSLPPDESPGNATGNSPGPTTGVATGVVTGTIDEVPTEVVVDGDEAVVVVPDLPAGTHTLTLKVHGQNISFDFESVPGQPLAGDARQFVADLIAEALRLLDEHLAAHPDDTAAADLRAQLLAAQAQLASLSDAELQAIYEQFHANPLPASEAPGACVSTRAGHEARVNALLRTARLTSWLAAKHAERKTEGTHVAVLLAQARMDEALRRLLAYTQAVIDSCGDDPDLKQKAEAARARHQRSTNAVANANANAAFQR
jgi:hypothetical protein